MRVRKTTFKKELKVKEEAFRRLSGEERLRMLCKINERFRKPEINYQVRGSIVTIKRLS